MLAEANKVQQAGGTVNKDQACVIQASKLLETAYTQIYNRLLVEPESAARNGAWKLSMHARLDNVSVHPFKQQHSYLPQIVSALGDVLLEMSHPKWNAVFAKVMACAESDPERLMSEASKKLGDVHLVWTPLAKA